MATVELTYQLDPPTKAPVARLANVGVDSIDTTAISPANRSTVPGEATTVAVYCATAFRLNVNADAINTAGSQSEIFEAGKKVHVNLLDVTFISAIDA